MDYEKTTNRLSSSRLIKVALITIVTLAAMNLVAFGIIGVCMYLISIGKEIQIEAYTQIVDIMARFSSGGAIATVATALIARYGAREATRNIGIGAKHE